jgi:DUF1365 family protein
VCTGTVLHRRLRPITHEFSYPLSYVWLDPDDPGALCDAHPLWSARHVAPARFRRSDYGTDVAGSLADAARHEVTPLLGRTPRGEVRQLTQVRRWGWLFNPITVYVVWDADPDVPTGAVLEVTNTPWKERHRYPVGLAAPDDHGWMAGSVAKQLHVSPFLDEEYRYDLRLRGTDEEIELQLDVVRRDDSLPTVTTTMSVERRPATRTNLGASLRHNPLPTHRVSAGIHAQALRLWRKGVPFVAHPTKREAMP